MMETEIVFYLSHILNLYRQSEFMDSLQHIIKNSIKNNPIGETDNFTWFISDIGIVALFKSKINISEDKILNEALNIALDLSKEEKEFHLIEGEKIILFYS